MPQNRKICYVKLMVRKLIAHVIREVYPPLAGEIRSMTQGRKEQGNSTRTAVWSADDGDDYHDNDDDDVDDVDDNDDDEDYDDDDAIGLKMPLHFLNQNQT